MIHREVITRKKIPVITTIVLIITIALYLNEYIQRANMINISIRKVMYFLVVIGVIILIGRSIIRWNTSYKHTIISNTFTLNKITTTDIINLESVKISDILYIGKISKLPDEYLKVKNSKRYLCNIFSLNNDCCVYKHGDGIYKFTFQPSEKFVNRIKNSMCKTK